MYPAGIAEKPVALFSSILYAGEHSSPVLPHTAVLEAKALAIMEVYCQLILANDLNYISEEQLSNIKEKIFIIGKMINGMRRRQLKRTSEQPSPHSIIL